MTKIIPAILVKSKKEFKEKVQAVAPYAQMIQIDIMDNKFVSNKTWGAPSSVKKALKEINYKKDFEVHLMVLHPERVIKKWVDVGAKRIIFHFESTTKPELVIKKIKENKCKVGIAINPETPIKAIESFINSLDMVLVMGVTPGFSGQKFQKSVLKKIKQIKKLKSKLLVSVDGGVNHKNAKDIIYAGANALSAASTIFKSDNIKEAIKKLNT